MHSPDRGSALLPDDDTPAHTHTTTKAVERRSQISSAYTRQSTTQLDLMRWLVIPLFRQVNLPAPPNAAAAAAPEPRPAHSMRRFAELEKNLGSANESTGSTSVAVD